MWKQFVLFFFFLKHGSIVHQKTTKLSTDDYIIITTCIFLTSCCLEYVILLSDAAVCEADSCSPQFAPSDLPVHLLNALGFAHFHQAEVTQVPKPHDCNQQKEVNGPK